MTLYTREPFRGVLPQLQGRHFDVVHLTPDWRTTEELRTGAGGLGVVSGAQSEEFENNWEAYKLAQLTVAYYCPYGYQHQRVEKGWMVPDYLPEPHPEFVEDTGVRFKLLITDKPCYVAVYQPRERERKHTAVILLSTDIEENAPYPELRRLTSMLYGEHDAMRYFNIPWENIDYLRAWQNAILGLGAFYALKELNISYKLVHCNDSHSVFFPLHQFGMYLREGLGHEQALGKVNAQTRFTNHTVVESGNRHYPHSVLLESFRHYAGFDEETFRWLDVNTRHHDRFYNTDVAMRLAGRGNVNGVAEEHAGIAERIWPGYEIFPITNGIPDAHVHPEAARLDGPHQIPDFKEYMKYEEGGLLEQLEHNAREAGYALNLKRNAMREAGTVLIGFARRAQKYKRPGILFHEAELPFVRMLHAMGQVAIAFGGKAHGDDGGMISDWNNRLAVLSSLHNGVPVFNYGYRLMLWMKAGSDIWVNAPIPGQEACGTSSMSAMRNYARVFSTNTGAIREATQHVRLFGDETIPSDVHTLEGREWNSRYQGDARDLWAKINEEQVLLRKRDPRLLEALWEARLFADEQYSAARMTQDYVKKLYRL